MEPTATRSANGMRSGHEMIGLCVAGDLVTGM
jgi:hypothetical protein